MFPYLIRYERQCVNKISILRKFPFYHKRNATNMMSTAIMAPIEGLLASTCSVL